MDAIFHIESEESRDERSGAGTCDSISYERGVIPLEMERCAGKQPGQRVTASVWKIYLGGVVK